MSVREGGLTGKLGNVTVNVYIVRDDVLVCTENRHQALVGVAVDQ